MPGFLDSFLSPVNADGSLDPQKMGMLNMLAAGAQSSQATRLPTSSLGNIMSTLAAYGQGGAEAAQLNPKLGVLNAQLNLLREQDAGRQILQQQLGGAVSGRSTLPLASGAAPGSAAPGYTAGPAPVTTVPNPLAGGGGPPGMLGGGAPNGQPIGFLNQPGGAMPGGAGPGAAPGGVLASAQPGGARMIDPRMALRQAQISQAYGLPGGDAYLKFAEAPPGFYRDQNGGLQIEQGGPTDPGYIVRAKGAEGFGTSQGQLPADLDKIRAQANADIRKAGPIAWAQTYPKVWGDLRQQEGAARFDTVEIRNPDGTTQTVPKIAAFGAGFGAPPVAGVNQTGGFNVGGAGGRIGVPGKLALTPEQTKYSEGLGEYGTALRDAANSGREQNSKLDQIDVAQAGFKSGAGADTAAFLKSGVNGLASFMGFDGAFKDSLPSYEEFKKLTTQYATEQARKMGAHEAASVVQMMVNANPNASMTEGALNSIKGGLRAMNDYAIAKGEASQAYRAQNNGSIDGFDTSAWMKQNHPTQFLLPYMTTDQLKKLDATRGGK